MRVPGLLEALLLDVSTEHLRSDLVPHCTSTRAIFPDFPAPQAPLDLGERTQDGPGTQTLAPCPDVGEGVPRREGAKDLDRVWTHLHVLHGGVILLRHIGTKLLPPLLDLAW